MYTRVAADVMSLTCDICRADWEWLQAVFVSSALPAQGRAGWVRALSALQQSAGPRLSAEHDSQRVYQRAWQTAWGAQGSRSVYLCWGLSGGCWSWLHNWAGTQVFPVPWVWTEDAECMWHCLLLLRQGWIFTRVAQRRNLPHIVCSHIHRRTNENLGGKV